MSRSINLFGSDTNEVLPIGYGRGEFLLNWELDQQPGPSLLYRALGGEGDLVLYLSKNHLSLLYKRFQAANPSGTLVGWDDSHTQGASLSPEETELIDKQVNIIYDGEELGYKHLRPYLPEIYSGDVIFSMARDPWLNVHLLGSAIRSGLVPDTEKFHPRWSPEWRAYCDTLKSNTEIFK